MQGYLLRFGEIPRRKGERIVLCQKSGLVMIYEILTVLYSGRSLGQKELNTLNCVFVSPFAYQES